MKEKKEKKKDSANKDLNQELELNEHNNSGEKNKNNINHANNTELNTIEQLKLDFVKESSKLQPNKNDNFMMRMTFDIMKRQTQERRLENIIEKTKNNECQKTISTNNNLITEEKIKYAQTLDSFSMPTINQEEYQFTSNNFTLQNIVEMETSIPPQTETDINIDLDNKRANNKNEKLKNKKEIKAKFIKKNIYGYNYKKNKIKKTDMNNNNKSLSKKRNCVTQKKILYKKIDGNDSKRKK